MVDAGLASERISARNPARRAHHYRDRPLYQKDIKATGMSSASQKLLSVYTAEILRSDTPKCGFEGKAFVQKGKDLKMKHHLAIVFSDGNYGIIVQAFKRGSVVGLSLSPISDKNLAPWEATSVRQIHGCKFTEAQVFKSYLSRKPTPIQDDVSSTCRASVEDFLINLLETTSKVARTRRASRELDGTAIFHIVDEEDAPCRCVASATHKSQKKGLMLFPSALVYQSAPSSISREIRKWYSVPFGPTSSIGLDEVFLVQKGMCVIFANEVFEQHTSLPNQAYTHDAKNLLQLFKDQGFHAQLHKNLHGIEVSKVFKKLAEEDYSKFDCLVCCFLTYGTDNDCLYTSDGKTISVEDIMEPFHDGNCKSLLGKPKLFFIEAFRNRKTQKGVSFDSADARCTGYPRILTNDDFLIAYSAPKRGCQHKPVHFLWSYLKGTAPAVNLFAWLETTAKTMDLDFLKDRDPHDEMDKEKSALSVTSTLTRPVYFAHVNVDKRFIPMPRLSYCPPT